MLFQEFVILPTYKLLTGLHLYRRLTVQIKVAGPGLTYTVYKINMLL